MKNRGTQVAEMIYHGALALQIIVQKLLFQLPNLGYEKRMKPHPTCSEDLM